MDDVSFFLEMYLRYRIHKYICIYKFRLILQLSVCQIHAKMAECAYQRDFGADAGRHIMGDCAS